MASLTTFSAAQPLDRAGRFGAHAGLPDREHLAGAGGALDGRLCQHGSCPAETGAVLVEVALTSAYPVLAAVTVTASGLPTKEGSTVSVGWVAPLIGTPSAFHW